MPLLSFYSPKINIYWSIFTHDSHSERKRGIKRLPIENEASDDSRVFKTCTALIPPQWASLVNYSTECDVNWLQNEFSEKRLAWYLLYGRKRTGKRFERALRVTNLNGSKNLLAYQCVNTSMKTRFSRFFGVASP